MGTPTITLRPVADLQPSPTNARTHSAAQVDQIVASLHEFGFTIPILADANGIVAGHGRALAAAKVYAAGAALRFPDGDSIPSGLVPVIDCTGWTPEQRRAYMLADNAIALNAGWDESILIAELAQLRDATFDLNLTGFDAEALHRLLSKGEGATDPEDAPEPPDEPVSRLGDIWIMGGDNGHRLICGSSTDPEDVAAVLAGRSVDIACSDPPYGISVVKGSSDGGAKPFGKVGGGKPHPFAGKKGRVHGPAKNAIIQPGTYVPIIGDDTTETAVAHYKLLVEIKVPVIVLWGGNYFANDLPPSRCWLVWDKENTGSFADAELAWTNQDRIVKLLRHQWSGLIKASERGERRCHPTQKPVVLAEWAIETLAPDARVLFDGFVGSGWTIIAAERRGISCVGLELSPDYVDVAVLRWQVFTGREATPRIHRPDVRASPRRAPWRIRRDDHADRC